MEPGNGGLAADFTSGSVIGILNVTTAISMAALVFAGQTPELFLLGVTIVLMSTVICGIGGVFGSGFGQVILAPRSGLAPVYATAVASVTAAMAPNDPAFTVTIIATIMMATLTTGLFLTLVGTFHLGNFIRYIPYPVMAGFFAGIGLIFMRGALNVAGGQPVEYANLGHFFSVAGMSLSIPAILLGIGLYAISMRTQHWSVFPLTLATATLIFYGFLFANQMSVTDAVDTGWLPEPSEVSFSFPLISPSDLSLVNWSVVFAQSGAFATLALLATIVLLVDTSGIEMIAEKELDHDRELRVAGATNMVNGALGGYIGVQTAADTAMSVRLGANSRASGVIYISIMLTVLVFGAEAVSLIPSFVLGGLLFFLGLDFLITWAWSKRIDFPPSDFAVVLIILGAIAFIGLLEGIAIGLVIAVILFVISYSRLEVVKSEHGGDAHDGIVVRHPEDRAYLKSAGRGIWIMRLQGFLFFGTADRLSRLVRERVEKLEDPGMEYLILDFAGVSEMDTSAIQAIVKLRKYADREEFKIVLTGLEHRVEDRLVAAGFVESEEAGRVQHCFHPSLEEGFVWCEEELLERSDRSRRGNILDLEVILERALGSIEAAQNLTPYFRRTEALAGDYLFHEGDDGDCLYVLASGVASVVIHAETDQAHTIRIFEQGTILGEMALFTGGPRVAAVHADADCVFYSLSRDNFIKAQSGEPLASGLFQSYIVRLLAERLDRANREIYSLR